jgi:succinyl-diaminopimelate desuccinylase
MNPDPLSLTRDLIALDTLNPPGRERRCAEYLGKLLENGGFAVASHEFAPDRTSLVAKFPGKGKQPPVCFTGHTDTVPLGETGWSVDPFGGETDGEKVYGRGASDMKSGVAAMVAAALRAAGMGKGAAGITLVITAVEESGSEGAKHLAGLNHVLGEAGALVVAEPTANYPLVGHKGALWLEMITTGVAAHGSMPEKGVNAIYKAARLVKQLQDCDFGISPHPVLGAPTLNVGTISGGANINSVPDRAVVGVDIRTVPGLDQGALTETLRGYLKEEMQIRTLVNLVSVATDPEDPWVQEIFDIMAPVLGERPEPRGIAYFTDASVLTPAYGNPPTVILGPGEPGMAHTTDEFCYTYRIEEATEAYLRIIKKWCQL